MLEQQLKVVSQIFGLPGAFEPHAQEVEFLKDYAGQCAMHRKAAVVLGFLTWALYIIWDYFHQANNPDFHDAFTQVIELRVLGIALLAMCLWLLFRVTGEYSVTYALLASVACAYGLLLVMMIVIPFPLNYLYYQIGLLLAMFFLFGFLRLRARPVFWTTVGLVIASLVTFTLIAARDADAVPAARYYWAAAVTYLFSFSIVGMAITIAIERFARTAFSRERALAMSNGQIQQKNDQLAALNASLEEARQETELKTAALVNATEALRKRAEQENANKSKFLADAVHDLRQPVQALTNFLEAARLAAGEADTAKAAALIEMAQKATRAMRASFNAFLELSRLESGLVTADYSNVDLVSLIDEITTQLRPFAAERSVRLRVHCRSAGPLVVHSDRHLLGRLLTNLVTNAIKYRDGRKGDRATVMIGIVALPNRCRIDVVDNGIGIPRGQWENVFKPFIQLDNLERDREKGLGLGLSIVNAIVHLLDAHRLDMRSIEGAGTRFSVDVPRGGSAPDAVTLEEVPAAGAVARSELEGLYVLYVEDDALVRTSTEALLHACGMLVEAASSVERLAEVLPTLERIPDLVITDYRLPNNRTARDVVAAVKQQLDVELPTILVTADTVDARLIPGLETARVLRKPVASHMLLREINSLCAAYPPRAGPES